MKAYKKMILTYVNKYKDLNFDVLSRELRLPVGSLVALVDELFIEGYINSVQQKISITDKGKMEVYNSWNEITVNNDDSVEQNFQWDELYVPKNFIQKL